MVIAERLLRLDRQESRVEVQSINGRLGEWLSTSETVQLPSLYLVNTRLWLDEMREKYGRSMTVGKVPDRELVTLADNYDQVWFMGIYEESEASCGHAKKYNDQYRYALPDIDRDKDVVASPFAIANYTPNSKIAKDWREWDRMVAKIHRMRKEVVVDFVPNHSAVDHPWVKEHPEYYVLGNEDLYRQNPNLFCLIRDNRGQFRYIAHGKDPNFPEWSDTLQLNYGNPEVWTRMEEVLRELARHADGVRCDMAMLVNPETFLRTWGWILPDDQKRFIGGRNFWREVVPRIKKVKRDFKFIAEAYWDEDELGRSFDSLYYKGLYDHLLKVARGESPYYLRGHIQHLIQNSRMNAVFVENHDEERAASCMGKYAMTAATVAGLVPRSLFLVNRGQEMGYMIRPPMQIGRQPNERVDEETRGFYENLMRLRRSRLYQRGSWSVDMGNYDDNLVAWMVESGDGVSAINCVNMGRNEGRYGIDTGGGQWVVYDVIKGSYSEAQNGGRRAETRLSPGEVKVVFLINEGKSSRRNLRF